MQPSHTHPTGRQAGLLNKWNRARGETIRVAAVKRSRSSISLPCPRSHAVCPKPRVAAPHCFPLRTPSANWPSVANRSPSHDSSQHSVVAELFPFPAGVCPHVVRAHARLPAPWRPARGGAVAIGLTDNPRIVGGDGSRRSCEPGSMAAKFRQTMPNPSATGCPVVAVFRQPAGRDAVRSVQTGDSAFREWRNSVLVARRSRFAH